jgi:2-polyprenyl-3-methyl-5-hydroxy-6-metoxy-1,4-benzoquinol methylase
MTQVVDTASPAETLAKRLFTNAVGAFELFSVYVGDVLGLYEIVREREAVTAAELAAAAGIDERYAREWLEGQGAAGLLEVEHGDAPRFRLPAGYEETLLDSSSLMYGAPMARAVVAAIRPIDALLETIRRGGGIPYADYGDDVHEAQAAFTRPMFERLLASEWLAAVPEIHERLSSEPPARVADIACGQGRSSIAIARAYANVAVDGIDSDEASIECARRHLASSGLAGRVSFHARDAGDGTLTGPYDLITIFEALHDMSYPVAVLQAARRALAADGVVLIGDERTEETFTTPAGELERLYYGFSLFHCLPVGMVGEGAAGTGTVMRPATLRRYAAAAGFSSCEILPIENDFWRFYLLRP